MLEPIFEELKARLGSSIKVMWGVQFDATVDLPAVRWDPKGALVKHAPTANGDIGERVWAVEVEVWEKDVDPTIALVDRIRAHLHDMGSHFTFPPDGLETWNTGGVTPRGVTCTFPLAIRMPIRRLPAPAIIVTDAEKIVVTGVIVNPTPPPDPLDPL